MEEDYIGYAFKSLDDAATREVEAVLAERPAEALRLKRIRAALEPLAWDKDAFEPPAGLIVRTVAMTAEHVVAAEGSVLARYDCQPRC